MKQHSSKMKKRYSPLIGAALAAASLFQFSLPAFAAGTSAGTGLVNKATATYSDADENTYDAISNEVTVTVGKIAGITNVASGNNDTDRILAGESVGFDFTITNTGNDVSSIFIPDTTTIGNYAGTTDNLTVNSVQFRRSSDPDEPASYNDRPDGGIVTNVAEDDFIIVRVNVTVDGDAADNADIAVQLGNTGENDNSVDTQNQPDVITGSPDTATDDVRTVTAADAATAVDGPPVNGQREASAVNTTQVNAVPIALPIITKLSGEIDQLGTPEDVQGDIIPYSLSLDVLSQTQANTLYPTGFNFSIEDLEGRDYSAVTAENPGIVNPATTNSEIDNLTNLILVSDAIPEGTELNTTIDGGVITTVNGIETPSEDWIPIYTQSPLTTSADEAEWQEDLGELDASQRITRVGWVYDASAPASGNGSITQGTSITGFGFEVTVTGTDPLNVYNLAQVFGSTDDDVPATTNGTVVLDESGDVNPSNFNDDGNGRAGQTVIDGNFAYSATPVPDANIDPGSNTGTGPAGEFNEVTVAEAATPDSAIFNGPGAYADRTPSISADPDAVGKLFLGDTATADDNHDFQNLSTATPTVAQLAAAFDDADTDGDRNVDITQLATAYDPAAKTFNNSVQNPNTATAPVDISLRPVAPSFGGLGGVNGDLPNNTTVTITYDNNTPADDTDDVTAEYTYNSGAFTISTTDTEITIVSVPVGAVRNYTVEVDLPSGTQLSTSEATGGGLVGGFPVPIVSYVDVDDDDNFDLAGDIGDDVDSSTTPADNNIEPHNVTINQLYTGFLQLEKTAVIIGLIDPENPDSAIGEVTRDPIPGDIIQYDVTYTNISEDTSVGEVGNILLTADDLIIVEDGTTFDADTNPNGNNWALDNDGDSIIDTLHVDGEASAIDPDTEAPASPPVTIRYANDTGATSTTDTSLSGEIVRYEFGGTNGIQGVQPGDSGIFRFQRRVTESSDSDS